MRKILLAFALLLSSCTAFPMGDSTASGVQVAIQQGNAQPGCGWQVTYTRHWQGATWPGCEAPLDASAAPTSVIHPFVSIWDAMCHKDTPTSAIDCTIETHNYRDAQLFWEAQGYDVVWVAAPPEGFSSVFNDRISDLNAAVAAELGCTLAPWSTRSVPPEYMEDDVHYNYYGGLLVGARLNDLGVESAC